MLWPRLSGEAMDSKEVLENVARRLNADINNVEALTAALAKVMGECGAAMNDVAIPGFGTFTAVKTDEHVEETADGRRMLLPPSVTMELRTGSRLRKALNSKEV